MSRRPPAGVRLTLLFAALATASCGGSEPPVDLGGSGDRTLDTSSSGVELLMGGRGRLVTVYRAPDLVSGGRPSLTDLAFNPLDSSQLWVLLRPPYEPAECTEAQSVAGGGNCRSLGGAVAVLEGATGENPRDRVMQDANAWHFMRQPTSLAFAENGNFATVGEARTGNFTDVEQDYIGPTLWTSDLELFGKRGPGGNGSHLDMLHATPFGMGIAHERGHAFWCFNGDRGALDRYDFHDPHEGGGADHSDGEVYRYVSGRLKRHEGLPSHMEFDAATADLYVADTGNGRVVRLDTTTGTPAGGLPVLEPLADHAEFVDARLTEVVPPGVVETPTGLALGHGVVLVADAETGTIHAFDRGGEALEQLETDLPAGSLGGLAVGPDARLYVSDLVEGAVYRIEAR